MCESGFGGSLENVTYLTALCQLSSLVEAWWHGAVFQGLAPNLQWSANLVAYQDISDNAILTTLWQQFWEALSLFQHDTKQGSRRHGLMSLEWRDLSGLHRTLTWTQRRTFGMNWNGDCRPGLVQLQCLTSWILYRTNEHKVSHEVLWKVFKEEWRLLQKGDQFYTKYMYLTTASFQSLLSGVRLLLPTTCISDGRHLQMLDWKIHLI